MIDKTLEKAQKQHVAYQLNGPPPESTACPHCGWQPLAWRNWESGGYKMRDLRCRECGWGQSGTA